VLWVVKGVVREVCPNPNGTQTLVRLATAGDILGLADKLNDKSQWGPALRVVDGQPVCARGRDARSRSQHPETDESRRTADALGADEFGVVGMGCSTTRPFSAFHIASESRW